ncbi:MAG: tripartite tricarboxylate transporter substrate binding protein, partial [Betaproteobacteria bacterium]|nr:tripartite tricarboxylate transporter substrate binding protein [Betaproteobacteria bacterium]
FIVSLAPGGGTDFVARVIAGKLSETWGQQVVVDNRPGAGSIIGAEVAAKAPADGYTLLMGTNSMLTQPSLFKNLPYNVIKDFAPVTLALRAPLMLTAHPSLGVSNLKELIALARAKPGELTYASPALATTGHLGGELFKLVTKVDILHIPYKGAGSAIANLLAGEVKLMYSSPPAVVMHVKAGKLKALGVTGAKRAAQAPEIPTFEESGVSGVEAYDFYGILAPAGTPRPVIAKLNAKIIEVLNVPEIANRFAVTQFAEVVGSTPEELKRFMVTEIARWGKVIRDANIRAE